MSMKTILPQKKPPKATKINDCKKWSKNKQTFINFIIRFWSGSSSCGRDLSLTGPLLLTNSGWPWSDFLTVVRVKWSHVGRSHFVLWCTSAAAAGKLLLPSCIPCPTKGMDFLASQSECINYTYGEGISVWVENCRQSKVVNSIPVFRGLLCDLDKVILSKFLCSWYKSYWWLTFV